MDYPWIVYQGILFVTKWHAIQVDRISTRPVSMILRRASSQISRFPGFYFSFFLNFYGFLYYFGRHRGPPRISLEAAGATRDRFGGILSFSDFSRNPKIMKNRHLSVSRDRFRRNKRKSMRNRGPVIFQPSIYIKNSRSTAPAAVMFN